MNPLQPLSEVSIPKHSLADWLNWLEQRNPNHIELGLNRVAALWQTLQHTDDIKLPTIVTVAGTNGKGSSVAMLEAILIAQGYRVGAYTSPHLEVFNERIRIQGFDIDDRSLVNAMARLDAQSGAETLTYFEWATLSGLLAFAAAKLDVWILEVGLGGRLDAVNILDADLALITNIGLDHQAILGHDRSSIAREKAGILRKNQVAVYADPIPERTIAEIARLLDCPIWVRGQDFTVEQQSHGWCLIQAAQQNCWPMPFLTGQMQIDNAAGVVALLQHPANTLPVSSRAIELGLKSAKVIGRFERWVHADRQIIFDVAHNLESVRALLENLIENSELEDKYQRFAVFGALNDKPISAMLAFAQPYFNEWFIGHLASARTASVASIVALLPEEASSRSPHETDIVSAYNHALAHSKAGDQIVVFGSFFTVSAIRHHLSQVGAHLV
ncbi:MAG: bifunctional folylpolyglutamate synthase/dihydrofolate synthase [Halothiobacillus sp.]